MEPLDSYLRAWRERWRREDEEDDRAAARARASLPHLVHLLVSEYAAKRVVLIGSLARGRFGRGSDIDLVVEGIPPERFWKAESALRREAGEFAVDLAPYETAHAYTREVVDREGETLYRAP